VEQMRSDDELLQSLLKKCGGAALDTAACAPLMAEEPALAERARGAATEKNADASEITCAPKHH